MAVDTTQSWQERTSDGSTAYFSFNFNYDTTRPGTIVVGKRTADNTYTVVNASNYQLIPNASGDGGQVRFIQNPSGNQIVDDIPPAGTIIRIERVSVETSSATWQIGLEMSELVNLFDRLFRLVQENKGGFDNVIKTFETQHNVSLYEMLASHDHRLFYWDNTNKTITPTDFPKEDVVRATNGLFLRISTSAQGTQYLEWSLNGFNDWHPISTASLSTLDDVELNNVSDGQFLMYNNRKWRNVTSSASVGFDGITGSPYDNTALGKELDIKTNCITEIPQDIKLELSSGTLTLKAGSKVYVPDGFEQDGVTPKFNVVTITSDLICGGYANLQGMIFVSKAGITTFFAGLSQIQSGSSGTLSSGNVWYDTTTNKIFRSSDGSSWDTQVGFPICIVTSSSGAISSIDQVFNGFGYIGSTVFALPGVKGLIPNGRNADGTLKNTVFTVSNVITKTTSYDFDSECVFMLRSNSVIDYVKNTFYLKSETTPQLKQYARLHQTTENKCYYGEASGWAQVGFFVCGTMVLDSAGKIANFTPKTAFHAVDYNDTEYMEHQAMPSNRRIDLTLGASGSNYTAPADGYVYFYMSQSSPHDLQVYLLNDTAKLGVRTYQNINDTACWIPVSKGDTFHLEYTYNSGSYQFRFIYANGAQ